MTTVEGLLVGGPWDGHVERVPLGVDGLPPARIPRYRETTVYTEDTGHMPIRIPQRAYRLIGPHPAGGDRWIYEPDPDDPLS